MVDYAFALLFGVVFQYFSIAPMSGEYGPKTIWRAVKADFLSLTFFEIGLFGWMAIFQIAIFDWKLQTNNVVYWWMMQVSSYERRDRSVTDANGRLECSWDTGRPSQSIGGLSLRVSRSLVLDQQSCIAGE